VPATIDRVSQQPAGTARAEPAPNSAIRTLALVGSPVALVTALLLYFGWARSQAQAEAFGADASVFDMSPQDLILRSVSILFFPIIVLLLFGLALVWIEPRLRSRESQVGTVLRFAWVVLLIGLLLLWLARPIGDVLLPLFIMVAIGGTAYGNMLRRYASGDRRPPRLANVLLVGSLLVACLFWQTERLARVGGEALAADLQANIADRLPAVTVYSAGQMQIEGPGVEERRVAPDESLFTHQYDGLYLLQRSGGKYFIVTDGWAEDEGRLLVLSDSQMFRIEFGESP
jgi:hypothetical protein